MVILVPLHAFPRQKPMSCLSQFRPIYLTSKKVNLFVLTKMFPGAKGSVIIEECDTECIENFVLDVQLHDAKDENVALAQGANVMHGSKIKFSTSMAFIRTKEYHCSFGYMWSDKYGRKSKWPVPTIVG